MKEFVELSEVSKANFKDSVYAKDMKPELDKISVEEFDKPIVRDTRQEVDTLSKTESALKEPIENKKEGMRREIEVEQELVEKYPPKEGYGIESEVYLRNEEGNIAKDPETGEARRIDFVITKNGEVIGSVEVTSTTADKTEQSAKEDRIRQNGGNYLKDSNGNLHEIPLEVKTRIERRE